MDASEVPENPVTRLAPPAQDGPHDHQADQACESLHSLANHLKNQVALVRRIRRDTESIFDHLGGESGNPTLEPLVDVGAFLKTAAARGRTRQGGPAMQAYAFGRDFAIADMWVDTAHDKVTRVEMRPITMICSSVYSGTEECDAQRAPAGATAGFSPQPSTWSTAVTSIRRAGSSAGARYTWSEVPENSAKISCGRVAVVAGRPRTTSNVVAPTASTSTSRTKRIRCPCSARKGKKIGTTLTMPQENI